MKILPKIRKDEYDEIRYVVNYPLLLCVCNTCLNNPDEIVSKINVNLLIINNVQYLTYDSCIELNEKIIDRHGNKFVFENDTDTLYFVAHSVDNYEVDENFEVQKCIVEKKDGKTEIFWKCDF